MPDEQEQRTGRPHLLLGQHPPDLMRAVAEPLQRLQLAVVVVGQGLLSEVEGRMNDRRSCS